MEKITVHIADNHQIVADGIKELLKYGNIKVVGVSNNGKELIKWCQNNQCDVIVLDISMQPMNGIEVLKYFKEKGIEHKVLE
ncbi:response regulator [Tenacibaculum tangerinum]|uniref:Response regulator n=1 Tax=Tenacibaculum tangerinum TaxID=3038772 RepID=A0ABY8KYA2_9FLAO|nr:response regulator [Tenacibaculum tangerinum]WGH74216.1 response regulator [Tenacibaculum tangerinum]